MGVPRTMRLLLFSSWFVTKGNTFRIASRSLKSRVAGTNQKAATSFLAESEDDDFDVQRNRLATNLLEAARAIGQVGKRATEENRHRLDTLAAELRPSSDPQPAHIPLEGTHELVYSGSDSGPTAGLVGPFVGKVTQVFWNETVYQNCVQLGPLQVSIFGERTTVDDTTVQVRFYQTQVHVFGKQLVQRPVDVQPGTWDHIFVGMVQVGGDKLLLRVMNTPKLFILEQPIVSP